MGLVDAAGLAEVVARHDQVIRILCGHAHRPIQTMFAGVPASVAPATSFQIQLKLDESTGIQWTREPPAFQLHKWTPEAVWSATRRTSRNTVTGSGRASYKAMEKASGLGES